MVSQRKVVSPIICRASLISSRKIIKVKKDSFEVSSNGGFQYWCQWFYSAICIGFPYYYLLKSQKH